MEEFIKNDKKVETVNNIGTKKIAIKNLLLTIDGTLQTSGYTYYTKTGIVNIVDDVLAMNSSTENNNILYNIYQTDEGEDSEDTDIGFNALLNTLTYRIECVVSNVGDEIQPRHSIKRRLNEVLSDLKALFGTNETLSGKALSAFYSSSVRKYATNNNRIKSGSNDLPCLSPFKMG